MLSPTMENQLLREPWVFPRAATTNVTTEEDSAALSAWEENFQDLSGWCIDVFQAPCAFPIGESGIFKLSGTKYEGNGVFALEEGLFKELSSANNKEECNPETNKRPLTTSTPELAMDSGEERRGSSHRHHAPWHVQNAMDLAEPSFCSGGQRTAATATTQLDLDDVACPASIDSTENPREAWDVLRTVETIGSDTFDLLSYLCDDDVHSPEGSAVSDSSGPLSEQRPLFKPSASPAAEDSTVLLLPPAPPPSVVRVKTEREEAPMFCPRPGKRLSSTITSSALDTPGTSSRRSEKSSTRTLTGTRSKGPYEQRRRESKVKKYRYCTDDGDGESADDNTHGKAGSHYRESREKNNEASRKSRMNKKAKESEMATRAVQLERDNRILKMKVEELEKLVTSMRSTLLRSALKREF